MENGNVFTTNDFYTAVILRVLGFPLDQLVRNNNKQVTFVFIDPNRMAERKVKAYWDRELPIPDARSFVEVISELKTRMYSKR